MKTKELEYLLSRNYKNSDITVLIYDLLDKSYYKDIIDYLNKFTIENNDRIVKNKKVLESQNLSIDDYLKSRGKRLTKGGY